MLRLKLLAIAAKLAIVFAAIASLAGTPVEVKRVVNRLQPGPQFFVEGRNDFEREIQFLLRRARISSQRLPVKEKWVTEASPLSIEGQIAITLEHSDLFEF